MPSSDRNNLLDKCDLCGADEPAGDTWDYVSVFTRLTRKCLGTYCIICFIEDVYIREPLDDAITAKYAVVRLAQDEEQMQNPIQ